MLGEDYACNAANKPPVESGRRLPQYLKVATSPAGYFHLVFTYSIRGHDEIYRSGLISHISGGHYTKLAG